MKKENMNFCVECRKETEFKLRKTSYKRHIRDKEYTFEILEAICTECGEQTNVPGLMDHNAQAIDAQYRQIENIVSIEDIQKLMEIYRIGKAPLSLALGFGEITITRYLLGQMPSKEYSDIIRNALESPSFMMEKLQENAEKIGETAYRKSMKAARELDATFAMVSDKMLLTISYIFERMGEITPLALQKLLYFIQGIYMVLYETALYDEDCEAWVHGPVYAEVYNMFKNFKYNPIEDNRFAMFRNRFQELTQSERDVIDLVIETFGMYSGKVLEQITHQEAPWLEARKHCLPDEASNVMIPKSAIQKYFSGVSQKYEIGTADGLRRYISDQLRKVNPENR